MAKIKWFSGGSDRSTEAINTIDQIINEFDSKNSLQIVLEQYKDELQKKSTSVPFILSRMNLDISKALRSDPITLSKNQQDKIKRLTSLSNIRYGY